MVVAALVVSCKALNDIRMPVEVAESWLERKSWSAIAPDEVLTISRSAAGLVVPMPTLFVEKS